MKAVDKFRMSNEEKADLLASLQAMEVDERYNTPSSYSPNTNLYPDNIVSFASKHMAYIQKYPNVDPKQYIQNLKLVSRS